MGRKPTNAGRLSIEIDPALKMRATVASIKAGLTLSQMVERGLTLALAELRTQAKNEEQER
jgi:hypothetical protein